LQRLAGLQLDAADQGTDAGGVLRRRFEITLRGTARLAVACTEFARRVTDAEAELLHLVAAVRLFLGADDAQVADGGDIDVPLPPHHVTGRLHQILASGQGHPLALQAGADSYHPLRLVMRGDRRP